MGSILLLGIPFAAIGIIWDTFSSQVFRTAFLGEAVPPIPAFAALLVLLPLRPVMGRVFRRLGCSDGELLATYGFLTIAVTVCFINGMRTVLQMAVIPYYGDPGDPALSLVRPHWPRWLSPTDPEVVRGMFQGSPDGGVPWSHWLVPMVAITGLLALLLAATGALFALLSRRWLKEERLTYPVAELAIRLVSPRSTAAGEDARPLFRKRIFWGGAALALAFNALWMLPVLLMSAKIPPQYTDLNALLPPGPWQAGYTWFIRYNPVVLGLGILVPTDVLLSIWVSTLLLKLEAVALAMHGYDASTTYGLAGRQGLGGYFAEAIFLLWITRSAFVGAARSLFFRDQKEVEQGDASLLALLVASSGALVALMIRDGMAAWLAVAFMAMLLVQALVIGRIRAQVGVPMIYFHLGGARGLISLLGGALVAASGARSVTALVAYSFLGLITFLAPYQADGFRLTEQTGLSRTRWVVLSVAAVACGALLSLITHLFIYYRYGGATLFLSGSSWPIAAVVRDALPASPAPSQWPAIGAGFLTTALCLVGHQTWIGWPLHPIGFLTACAIGGYVFAQSCVAWLIKSVTLRWFGSRAYLKVKDFFLGLVIGHFALAALWGLLGLMNYGPAKAYTIGFW